MIILKPSCDIKIPAELSIPPKNFCNHRKIVASSKSQVQIASFAASFRKEREGVPEMGAKPLSALRVYPASNRGSKGL